MLDYDGPGQSDYMCGNTFTLAQLKDNKGKEKDLIVISKKGKYKGYIMVTYFEVIDTGAVSQCNSLKKRNQSTDSEC